MTEKKMLKSETNNKWRKMLWLFVLVILFLLLGVMWLIHFRAALLAAHPFVATSRPIQQQVAMQQGPISNSVKTASLVPKTGSDTSEVRHIADLSNIHANNDSEVNTNSDSEEVRYQFLLDEIEYGLHIGYLQLLATNNVQNAFSILKFVQKHLDQFTQSDLAPLKQSVALAIEQLKSSPLLDMSSLVEKFAALTENVDNLPFLADVYFQSKENHKQLKKMLKGPSYQRVWDQFMQTLKSGIQVRRLDKIDPILVTADQAFFIRENLKLRLLIARVALMQQRSDTFAESLQEVQHTVKVYFDGQSKITQKFLDILEKLISLDFSHVSASVFEPSLTIIDDLQRKEKIKSASTVAPNKPQLDQKLADKKLIHLGSEQKEQ